MVDFSITESTIEKKLEAFQKALYRHQMTTPEQKIYHPETMKQFTDKKIALDSLRTSLTV